MTQDAPPSSEALLARRLKRRRICRGLLLSAIIFACGGITGWGVSLRHGPHGNPERADPPVEEVVSRMKEELFLTSDQTTQITVIYQKRFAALQAIRKDMLPKLKTEYDGLHSDVQKILTPEQYAGWNKRFEDARNRMLPHSPRPEDHMHPGHEGFDPHDGPHDGPQGGPHDGPLDGPHDGLPPDRYGPPGFGGPPPELNGQPHPDGPLPDHNGPHPPLPPPGAPQ